MGGIVWYGGSGDAVSDPRCATASANIVTSSALVPDNPLPKAIADAADIVREYYLLTLNGRQIADHIFGADWDA